MFDEDCSTSTFHVDGDGSASEEQEYLLQDLRERRRGYMLQVAHEKFEGQLRRPFFTDDETLMHHGMTRKDRAYRVFPVPGGPLMR